MLWGVQTMTKTQNLRTYHRHLVEVSSQLVFRESHREHETTTIDVSGGGARFSVAEELCAGDFLLVRLTLSPGVSPIECKARVCWRERANDGLSHVGVRFLDLQDEEAERLDRFLNGPVFDKLAV